MRLFVLERRTDVSGVSGVGTVVEGVEFSDGRVALRWRSEHASTAIYDDIATVVTVHGHDGATKLVWL